MKPTAIIIAILLSLPLHAAEVIRTVTVTASSEWGGGIVDDNLVNNSGLRTAGSTPANQTPTSYDVTAVHTNHGSAVDQWHTATGNPTPTIDFNLGGTFSLDAIHIWNGNQTNLTTRGVKQFDILVSTDGVNFTEVLSDQTLTQSPNNTFISAQVFNLTGNNGITNVRLRVDSNWGNAYTGLSEVMFTQFVDPALNAPTAFDKGTVSSLVTSPLSIPISNSGPAQTLNISSVSVEGNDASSFSVDAFPSTLAAGGGAGNINLSFNPLGATGLFTAVVKITSNRGGVPGTVTEIPITVTSAPDPDLSVASAVTFPGVHPSATRQMQIPVNNLGLTQALAISGVTVTGPDSDKFTINSSPTTIPAASAGNIAVTFDPEGVEGNFSAALEITCNDEGFEGTVVTVNLQASTDLLGAYSHPTIMAASPGFNGDYTAANLFDGTAAEFATAGGGAGTPLSQANGTWVELDFGAPVPMDRMIMATRLNDVDVVGSSRLILSNDPVFDETDTIHVFNPTGSGGHGFIQPFAATVARYARWEVVTSTGTSQNLGGMEFRILNTPAGSYIAPSTVIGGATPFNGDHALANAANGDAGRGAGSEYASQSLGADMFVDFDLGTSKPITGFDLFDRLPAVDRTSAFDLLLSDDPTFSTGVTTLSFTPGTNVWPYRRSFAPVTARYIRFDATNTTGAVNNSGMQEMMFYSSQPAATPFEQYITGTWGLSGANATPAGDYDADGLVNAIEFVLGSDPSSASAAAAPTGSLSPTQLVFTFRRSNASVSDAPRVEYGSNLTGWTTAVNGVNGVSIVTVPNGFGSGIDSVTVSIPRALAANGRLFARLAVEVATTP